MKPINRAIRAAKAIKGKRGSDKCKAVHKWHKAIKEALAG